MVIAGGEVGGGAEANGGGQKLDAAFRRVKAVVKMVRREVAIVVILECGGGEAKRSC